MVANVSATVVRMPRPVRLTWSLTLWGASAAKSVTALWSGRRPRLTCSGSQGEASSFSATQ